LRKNKPTGSDFSIADCRFGKVSGAIPKRSL